MTWTDSLPDGFTAAVGGDIETGELAELMRHEEARFSGQAQMTPERIEGMLTGPNFDRDEGIVLLRNAAGQLVGAGAFHLRTPWVSSFVETWVEANSDGRALRMALEAWARELAVARIERAPAHAQVAVAMGCHGDDTDTIEMLHQLGYHEERYFLEMVRQLDGPVDVHPMPEGLTLRTLGPGEDVDRLAMAVNEAFRDHFGHAEEPIEDRIERWRHSRNQPDWDDDLVWLAEGEGELAAFNTCLAKHGSDASQGYVASLGVLRQWRGRGLARALLTESFAEYQRRGMTSVSLHVDADSLTGATRLYEGVGMVETNRYIDFELVVREGEDLIVR